MPRGPSLGHTAYIPEKERYHVTKQQLLAMMDTMMGGRAAEELIFGADKITSGKSLRKHRGCSLYVNSICLYRFRHRCQQRPETSHLDCGPHGQGVGHVREGWPAHDRRSERVRTE